MILRRHAAWSCARLWGENTVVNHRLHNRLHMQGPSHKGILQCGCQMSMVWMVATGLDFLFDYPFPVVHRCLPHLACGLRGLRVLLLCRPWRDTGSGCRRPNRLCFHGRSSPPPAAPTLRRRPNSKGVIDFKGVERASWSLGGHVIWVVQDHPLIFIFAIVCRSSHPSPLLIVDWRAFYL